MTHQPPPSMAPRPQPLPAGTATASRDQADTQPMPMLRSEELLRGRRAVEILHAGVRYRLSVTALGKLILTK